ncbi:LysR family transcriptional regulator [Ferrimonas sediminicola]|uniref:LysR family transcriptional regulator n=1 Tax=Ferrimonas sediminicola TaxID=2569538 RepID=A0A4U1BCL7_9GAMM|nr:LysR family transcriptional regulator [Ferrimonas sediminicola]TKB48716.1 LysR family transcriptional regulator [Ferrimonas sediminicola]
MIRHTDLNLLRILLTLLEELSVSRTAEKLCLTQSAVSKQLARLRQQLADPLFIRHPKGLTPTPRARSLEPQVRTWLAMADEMLEPQGFDPATSQRRFRLALTETCFATLLTRFLGPMMSAAPGIMLETKSWEAVGLPMLGKGEVDLAIFPRDNDTRAPHPFHVSSLPKNLEYVELSRDDHVCLVHDNHPVLTREWSLEQYVGLSHLKIECEGSDAWLLDQVLAETGHQLIASMRTSDFYSAALLCQHSDLAFTCTRSFADRISESHHLVQLPLPLQMEPLSNLMGWPAHLSADPAHRWLREFIVAQCQMERAAPSR